jgi:hypothetical protein
MSHADQLIEITTDFAMDAKDNVADLQRKLSAVEIAKVELEARLHLANHALARLSIASLRPASGGDSGHDNFQCETCKSNFNLQI